MPPLEAPLNAANQHAANADDFLAQGLLIPAAEAHTKAAESYTAAIERCTDENTKRTLRMLCNDHTKAYKELQRKIAKLREENKDPALPQKPTPLHTATHSVAANYNPRPAAPSPPPHRRMTDSQNTVDESFMVLGQRSDPGDAFNQFWDIMQGMLDNLSQPVAFATAPLGQDGTPSLRNLRRDGSLSSDTDIDEPMTSRFTRKLGMGKSATKKNDRSLGVSARTARTPTIDLHEDEFDEDVFEGDELSESFCLIPSGSEPSPLTLKRENMTLKAEVETMQKRLAATERVLHLRKEQDQQLRDSIVMARREAQRAMTASTMGQRPGPATIDFNALNINIPPIPSPVAALNPALNPGRDRESQLVRRVRELEEEVRVVRVENEKQKAMIAKFRERWDKLKESAKRKKDAKAAMEPDSSVRERIDEEPELDEAVSK